MNGRHAYLIMAHHRFDILDELLRDLDHPRNDIFLHIDKKAKDFNPEKTLKNIKQASPYLAERMNIHWGGYSQIKCIMTLLKKATESGEHDYYHFLGGVEFPLKNQDDIHRFFLDHYGYEFIGFDGFDTEFPERIKYYHFPNEYGKTQLIHQKGLNELRKIFVWVQKTINIDKAKRYQYEFKKGSANWSITNGLARLIVSKENEIESIYKHTFCGDELFIHTIVFNSDYWNRVYDQNDEYHSSMRITTWENKEHRFHLDDLDDLLNSGRLFARKIDGEDALELIHSILKKRNETAILE